MRFAAAFLFLALSGCISPGKADATLSVAEVVEQRVELEAQRINVVGTLSECQPLSCVLTSGEYYLSIGTSVELDSAVPRYIGKDVVISAKFNGDCVSDPKSDRIALCSDHSNTLAEPRMLGLARFFRS